MFDINGSPFANGVSSQAREFANQALGNILPWLKEHYEMFTTNPAAFTPAALYNYHLRGDFYLGLTNSTTTPPPTTPLQDMGLDFPLLTPARLVNIARPNYAYDDAIATSVGLVNAIEDMPTFPGVGDYGVEGATAGIVTPDPAHFFTREAANGSMLTEFLLGEQATIAYRLLPYMDNFHAKVRDFISSESTAFLGNARRLCNTVGNNTTQVHQSVRLDNSLFAYLDTQTGLIPSELGIVTWTNFTPAGGGNWNAVRLTTDFTVAPYADFSAFAAAHNIRCVLPIYLACAAHREYIELIRPGIIPAFQVELDDIFNNLLLESVRTSLRLNQNFAQRTMSGIERSHLDGNNNRVRDGIREFLNTYFNMLTNPFPVGTVVELNRNVLDPTRLQPNRRRAVNEVINAANVPLDPITLLPTRSVADLEVHIDANPFFIITATGSRRAGNRRINTYQLQSTDQAGVPLFVAGDVVTTGNIDEEYPDGNTRVPTFTLFTTTTNTPAAHTPLSIVGRLLLSASYSIFNAGAYYSSQRDMRKLTKDAAPGHFAPILEAMGGAAGMTQGRASHNAGHAYGIIDFYAESRADLLYYYLAGMFDSIKGRYRDEFVAFYTGDFHTNEVSYYTNAISNYIDNQVRPENADAEPVLVGPRLVTRVPRPLPPVGLGPETFLFTRSADPEVVYYQIDSPLLRECLRTFNTRFYEWYTNIAQQFDRGQLNLTRGGNEEDRRLYASRGDPSVERSRIAPTKVVLDQMWPLITQRATSIVESGEVPADVLLGALAEAVRAHRENTSQAFPAVPVTNSFINFGELLRSPTQYALPPSLSTTDITAFLDFLHATYYNDYALIAILAANIEDERTRRYSQDQLISTFKAQLNTYRNTKVLNRFPFPAIAHLIRIFREQVALPTSVRAAEAATITTRLPQAPEEQDAIGPSVPEPIRRLV